MNTTSTDIKKTKSRFVLTRKNQKGQVAIFVALIFQVIFIFFALLINVGLVVHHKINLQHSVDLAAYYGAMKQAESMNAIAHINFQMRQAWKLFTWRYRVLGTFGLQKTAGGQGNSNPAIAIDFPFESRSIAPVEFRYFGSFGNFATSSSNAYVNGRENPNPGPDNAANPAQTCRAYANTDPGAADYIVDGAAIGPQDVPFFCIGHSGFAEWAQTESNCQLNCPMFKAARPIASLPMLGTTYNTPFGGNVAGSVNTALQQVNGTLSARCAALNQVGAILLARFMTAYTTEARTRSETIKLLAANLSLPPEEILDLDGKKILDGTRRTLENNLTGANFTGLDQSSFQTYNGLSDSSCSFKGGQSSSDKEFLKLVEFKLLNLFIHSCVESGSPASYNYEPKPVYVDTATPPLNPIFSGISQPAKDVILSLLNDGQRFTSGYEKNPNCIEYFAVKASSEPTIPFLPLSKIKLDAVAIAKPFGGSIGPSFGKTWPKGSSRSNFNDGDPNSRVDKTLPMREFASGAPTIRGSVYSQPNFSLFVGDRLGLRNLDYLAAFHSMLAIRDLGGGSAYTSNNENNSPQLSNATNPPGKWPTYKNWTQLDDAAPDLRQYDSLAADDPNSAGLRALEIAAIVPNQFDVTYYSIDPDFYTNYYVRLYKSFDDIKNAVGGTSSLTKQQIRPDFGAVDVDADSGPPTTSLNPKTFSVKDQILLKNIILDRTPTKRGVGSVSPTAVRGTNGNRYTDFLNYLVSSQSSLLTGWTFKQYSDYTVFPENKVNLTDNTMAFGQCLDAWNNTENSVSNPTDPQNFKTSTEVSSDKPPAPGNCITGGRTGYSVKIISPSRVLDSNQSIENPIDQSFFNF